MGGIGLRVPIKCPPIANASKLNRDYNGIPHQSFAHVSSPTPVLILN